MLDVGKRERRRVRRHHRVRLRVFGTAQRPRLNVFRSNAHLYAQVIDDTTGRTLLSASTLDKELTGTVKNGGNVTAAAAVGRVVADEQGLVGVGKGKAAEVPEAISKAVQHAKKNLVRVTIKNGTIPHEVHGQFGAEHVLLKPASAGTGIVAGGAVRAVIELAGIHNIVAKTLGRGNPFNVVQATLDGLNQLRDPDEVLRIRKAIVQQAG